MRGFFLAMDNRDLDVFETRVAKEPADLGFGEPEPHIGVHIAGFLVVVTQKIQHHDAAARFQNPMGLADGLLWMLRRGAALCQE